MKTLTMGAALLLPLILNSCDKKSNEKVVELTPLEKTGKAVYMSNCMACHNPDPRLPGSVGPDVAYSSEELLRARILKAEYPVGYKAKRESHLMPALPQLENDIPAVHAYLNSFKK